MRTVLAALAVAGLIATAATAAVAQQLVTPTGTIRITFTLPPLDLDGDGTPDTTSFTGSVSQLQPLTPRPSPN